jgi:XTP/dITP diphosphohydrolase
VKLLVASTNPNKILEIRQILEGVPIHIVTLDVLPPIPEPEETGSTFAENARLKALYYNAATGIPSVADDSGIEIDALENAPGVQSARWHGSDYTVKFAKIYELLRVRGVSGSRARFVAAVAFAEDGSIAFESEGIVSGEIAPEPRGTHGFGYDPIFFYPPLACTLAEVNGEAKAAVSHRGAAFRDFKGYLLSRS